MIVFLYEKYYDISIIPKYNVTSVFDVLIKKRLTKKKFTKILNSEENSKRKVPNQMAKSNDKTHQPNGQQMSYS